MAFIRASDLAPAGPLRYFMKFDDGPWREMSETQFLSLFDSMCDHRPERFDDVEFEVTDYEHTVRGIVTGRYPPI